MKAWIFTGGRPSNSAAALSANEGFKRMVKGKFVKPDDVIINWGFGGEIPVANAKVINKPEAVRQAVNKFKAFTALSGADVETVPWTANLAVAQEWQANGNTIIARTTLTGHSGDGIVVVDKGEPLVDAPLYTRYIFKEKEFRVHATKNKVLDTHRKVRDPAQEPKSWKIRSHDNGFIFQRTGIEPDAKRDKLAIAAVKALGLDFGAVDIVEDKQGKCYVLEVNTAPGLEGVTIPLYATGLKELAANVVA
jgi:hypothetical protein